MDFDITLIAAAGLATLAIGALAFILFAGGGAGAARKRLHIDRQAAGGFGKRKTREKSLQENAVKRLTEIQKDSKRVSLRLRLTQAGLSMSPTEFMLMFQMIGVAAGGVAYLISGELYLAAGLAVAVAFGGPRAFLSRQIDRRRTQFTAHFPNAIDIMVRGVKSGLPVNEGLRVIAEEIPNPVKTEFRLVVDSGQVGVPLEDALTRMAERVPTQDVNFFRTVLSIQKQTGGNLAEALGNLSETLRERHKLKLKVRALTGEARASAYILGCLPLVVGGAVYLLRPDYIEILFTDERGKMMLYGAGVWMSFGVLTLRAMVNFKTW